MPNSPGAGVLALDDLPLVLTVEEAASVLRIGRNTAYTAVADGSLPAIRIGSRIRIPRAGLATLLHQDSNGNSPPRADRPSALARGDGGTAAGSVGT